jgi:hypothetical protein
MNNELQLNEKIIAITARIREQHPELAPYMAVVPVAVSEEDQPGINLVNLQLHYQKLQSMLRKYAVEFPEPAISLQ